jgi:hypothetical protein
VIADRVRGALLYACAGVVLVAGSVWWFRAAPRDAAGPQIEQWRRTAERLLPDAGRQEAVDTLALAAGVDHEVVANVAVGLHTLSVVCVGGQASEVRIRLGTQDSGRGMPCSGSRPPVSLDVALPGQLRMNVSVGDAGPVVLRYSLQRAAG